jgi:hypothetical protein
MAYVLMWFSENLVDHEDRFIPLLPSRRSPAIIRETLEDAEEER